MAREQQPPASDPTAHGDGGWWDQAACLRADPEVFYPEKGESNADAKRVCATCPVRIDCLENALEHNERYGVWGGLSAQERRVVARHVARRGISVRDLRLRVDSDRELAPPPDSKPKITRGQAEEIRARYAAGGMTQTALADEYGVTRQAISRICRDPASHRRGPAHRPPSQAKITRRQVEEIRARYAAGGITQAQLAGEYGIGQHTVSRIVAGRTWRDTTAQPQPQPQHGQAGRRGGVRL